LDNLLKDEHFQQYIKQLEKKEKANQTAVMRIIYNPDEKFPSGIMV